MLFLYLFQKRREYLQQGLYHWLQVLLSARSSKIADYSITERGRDLEGRFIAHVEDGRVVVNYLDPSGVSIPLEREVSHHSSGEDDPPPSPGPQPGPSQQRPVSAALGAPLAGPSATSTPPLPSLPPEQSPSAKSSLGMTPIR